MSPVVLAAPPAVVVAVGAGPVRGTTPLVVLLEGHAVRSAPHAGAHRIGSVPARTPLTGVHTVLPVLATATAPAGGGRWVRVALPGRPNGRRGWIAAAGTRRTATPWAIDVQLGRRRVVVSEHGRVVRRFGAIVGKRATPTPRGTFFVEEAVRLRPGAHGGPYALATSARSNVLQEFEGGPGQIALHGVAGLAGAPGTAASHGCVRLSAKAITWLARRIGAGVPVRIG
jgi:lipoprotein-anchoring transpeptidase ErfK/SrfK